DWQRLLMPLAANAADLPQLEIPRAQLAAILTQLVDLKKQQAAGRAVKETASQQVKQMLSEGQRLATLLRQALRQHYGPASPKLSEFDLLPFRGHSQSAKTPTPPPPPAIEVQSATPAPSAAPKVASDPASHS
ncbi:MAG TPA: hypothetical protein VFE33_14995, partial [Thermoanaerobaculia bacterium]|nr:hypothetical protein [Thermoanaerobaculia bacterium]